MAQAIETKYLGPTNFKASRIKASCDRGSKTFDYDHELNGEENHISACKRLRIEFAKQDQRERGHPYNENSWLDPMICGGFKNKYYHIFKR